MKSIIALSALATLCRAINIEVSGANGNVTSSKQYGVMFEDINRGGDGGIYAELIRNRAFYNSSVYPADLTGFEPAGDSMLTLEELDQPLSSALPYSMRVAGSSTAGFANGGFWGISVQPQTYTGSFYVKGNYKGSFTAALVSNITGDVYASTEIVSQSVASEWIQHNFTLVPAAAAPNVNNTLTITFDAASSGGYLDFNLISLFPPTFKGRPNGNRIDLMEALQSLKPRFLRFPGGSDLEGTVNGSQWQWRTSVGPLKDRPGRPSIWGYPTSSGLGLVEFMNWCDDLDMEPILAVWDGLYLSGVVLSEEELVPWVNEAMNELEFLMGGVDTEYGALRASLGHPKPWTVNYVEVGNEDNLNGGTETYFAYRFPMFRDAINAKYPHIKVMSSMSLFIMDIPEGSVGDYHQYSTPDAFLTQFSWFDQVNVGNDTLVGELATVYPNTDELGYVNWTNRGPSSFPTNPWWIGSIGEAVFMLGAERNSEKVIGCAFAPTMRNTDDWQWSPDLISFNADPSQTTTSTSHEVISLFSAHKMTLTLPATHTDGNFNPLFYVAGYQNHTNAFLFKGATYNSTEPIDVSVSFPGVHSGAQGKLTVLTAPSGPYASNEVGGPSVVDKKVTIVHANSQGAFEFTLQELSVVVLKSENVNAAEFVDFPENASQGYV